MDPFHLIHLEDLKFDIPPDLKQLSSSQLFLVPISANCPSSTRFILRELRRRREGARERVGITEGTGIYAAREIRQKDRWFGIEWIPYDFDLSNGIGEVTSAQLLVLIWKIHLNSTDELAEDAEDEFIFRRERDFGLKLHLEVPDDVREDQERNSTPQINTEPPSSPLNFSAVQDQIPTIASPPPPPSIQAESVPPVVEEDTFGMMEYHSKPIVPTNEEIYRPIASTSRLPPPVVDHIPAEPSRNTIHPSRLSNMAPTENSRGSSRETETERVVIERSGVPTDPRTRSRSAPAIAQQGRNSGSISPRRSIPPISIQSSAVPTSIAGKLPASSVGCTLALAVKINNLVPSIFIGRLPINVAMHDLEELLKSQALKSVAMKISKASKNNTKWAFVAFSLAEEAEAAVQKLNNNSRIHNSRFLSVSRAREAAPHATWYWNQFVPEFRQQLWNQAKEMERGETRKRERTESNRIGQREEDSSTVGDEMIQAREDSNRKRGREEQDLTRERTEQLWEARDEIVETVSKRLKRTQNFQQPPVPPATQANSGRLLPRRLCDHRNQLFISNIPLQASDAELLEFFGTGGKGCIAIQLAEVQKNYNATIKRSSRVLWMLFIDTASRDDAIIQWESRKFPGRSDLLRLDVGEKGKAREKWYESGLLAAVDRASIFV